MVEYKGVVLEKDELECPYTCIIVALLANKDHKSNAGNKFVDIYTAIVLIR